MSEDYIELNKKNTEFLLKKGIANPGRYERLNKNRYSIQLSMLSEYVTKDLSFLDIGIREGAFIEFLKEKGFTDLYGIDIYEKSVELARNKGIECEVADAQYFCLDRKFDVIVMSHVLEHCPEPGKVIYCVSQHLNENGIVFIEVPVEQGSPVPTEKDAHYYNFHSLADLLLFFEEGWELLEKFESKKRLKVVVRRTKYE